MNDMIYVLCVEHAIFIDGMGRQSGGNLYWDNNNPMLAETLGHAMGFKTAFIADRYRAEMQLSTTLKTTPINRKEYFIAKLKRK